MAGLVMAWGLTAGLVAGVVAPLAPLLHLLQLERSTCSLLVRSGARKGRLHFRAGELVNAYAFELDVDGEAAARHLLAWERATIDFERSLHNHVRGIHTPLAELLLDVAREQDERERDRTAAHAPDRAETAPAVPDLDAALGRLSSALGGLRARGGSLTDRLADARTAAEDAAQRAAAPTPPRCSRSTSPSIRPRCRRGATPAAADARPTVRLDQRTRVPRGTRLRAGRPSERTLSGSTTQPAESGRNASPRRSLPTATTAGSGGITTGGSSGRRGGERKRLDGHVRCDALLTAPPVGSTREDYDVDAPRTRTSRTHVRLARPDDGLDRRGSLGVYDASRRRRGRGLDALGARRRGRRPRSSGCRH